MSPVAEHTPDPATLMPAGAGRGAVVLLSGGLDSATALALATARGWRCHALSFAYGQKHAAELGAAERVAEQLRAIEHRVIHIEPGTVTGSALTDSDRAVPEVPGAGIPTTYVPARNTIFLAFALGRAEALELTDLVLGVNAVDYSGYPDCRPAFVEAFERLANLATRTGVEGRHIAVRAPLIELTKAQIIRLGTALGVDYAETVSCYQADAEGRACGRCDSCRLRRRGFEASGVVDPTRYRA